MDRSPRSSAAVPESGFCTLHGKRRSRADLISWSQQPGKMRCLPQKECYVRAERRPAGREAGRPGGGPMRERERRGGMGRAGGPVRGMGVRGRGRGLERSERLDRRERGESAMCRLHRMRRPVRLMREVGHGVFECMDGSRCKQSGDRRLGPVGGRGGAERGGRFHDRRGPSFAERGGGPRARPLRGERATRGGLEQRYDDANAAAWAPSAGAAVGGGIGVRRRAGRAERKVWCALHGKHLPASQCEFVQDCCYVCLDPSTCLATPLEAPAMLLTRGCAEVLCSKHHTLRSAGFVELTEKPVAYQCMAGHACRGVTVPHMRQDAGAAATGAVPSGPAAMAGALDDMDDEGVYTGARTTNTFLPQSGREAVSSFFM